MNAKKSGADALVRCLTQRESEVFDIGGAKKSLEEFAELAARYDVLPALSQRWFPEGNKARLPASVLDEMYAQLFATDSPLRAVEPTVMVQLASRRTELHVRSLLDTFQTIRQLLHAASIQVVPIKGSDLLTRGIVRPGSRSMRDLDLLVREDQAAAAHQVLADNGFNSLPVDQTPAVRAAHHLPALIPPSGIGSVELHTELMAPPWSRLLPPTQVWARVSQRNGAWVLHDSDAVALIIAHQFGSDAGWRARTVPVRSVIDIHSRTQAKDLGPIDWTSVADRFDQADKARVLEAWHANATRLGRSFVNDLDHSPAPVRARLHARQSLMLSRYPAAEERINRFARRVGVLDSDVVNHQFAADLAGRCSGTHETNAVETSAARIRYVLRWIRRRRL